ncbi:MAG TPA: hypothetical protein VI454_10240 [Verrucomicrobiae bacterium]|jgi:hypothetical protein
MSTAEAILKKLNALPPEKQEDVLHYVESISQQPPQPAKTGEPHAWIDIALKANLQGPPDWSEHLDDYLYGDKKNAL